MDWIAIWLYATPLICAAIGDVVAQRSGFLNIGLEGQMLLAAFVGFWAAHLTGSPWFGLASGMLAGAVLAMIAAAICLEYQADQIVVGMALLMLALGLSSYGYRSAFGELGSLSAIGQLPKWNGVDFPMLLGALGAFAVALWVFRSRKGLQLRACGEYPEAAQASGVNVKLVRYAAVLFAGMMAGLAGAELSLGISGSFSENMTQGRGFVALAMVSFGRWHPIGVLGSCLLIGSLESLQFVAQSKGWEIPFRLMLALPYAAAVLVLVIAGRGAAGPQALGQPYSRSK